jgi:NAD(P)H-hydrate epimerase
MTIKLFSVAEMVAAEKAADAAGVSYAEMMERAGRAVAEVIAGSYPVAGRPTTILVGPGNNGGDGLVAGYYLAQAGADVTFYLFKPRDRNADPNLARVHQQGLPVLTAEFDQRFRVLRTRLNITDILVDALLGTGATRPIGGDLARLMSQVAAGLAERRQIVADRARQGRISIGQLPSHQAGVVSQSPGAARFPAVVAVDCPSGMNSDSGELDPLAIPADLTVTFAGPKRGHLLFPAAGALGELVIADIGIAATLPEVAAVKVELVTAGWARQRLPERPRHGHKGTFGSALLIAGSARYWGAPVLAGRGAYRAGAGLVALAVPESIRAASAIGLPEATFPPVAAPARHDAATAATLLAGLGSYRGVLVGPGMDEAGDFMAAFLAAYPAGGPPLVIDADGLNALARMADWWSRLPPDTILTPHPGEMARLVGDSAGPDSRDRLELARHYATAWRCILLLKGAYTVIARPDGHCAVLPFANPVLATAGSGDVLAGAIAALLAQGVAPFDAAALGGYLHGAAGELAAASLGDSGALARDIADQLPLARQRLRAIPPLPARL